MALFAHPRRVRLVALAGNVFVLALIVACCNPGTTSSSHATVTVCANDAARARDFPADACFSGTLHAVGQAESLRIAAVDKNGQPLKQQQLTVTITGANARSATVTTDGGGLATYSYAASAGGTDTIQVALANDSASKTARPAVIHWIASQHVTHPIILVHGIHEDAADFAHQFNPAAVTDSDQATDGGDQTWTALIEGLKLVYDPGAMEAFCYVDDFAWVTAPSACPTVETPTCNTTEPAGSTASDACVSQSSVDLNGVMLAHVISDLSARNGGKKVTLLAYSMGSAIVRTLLAGCLSSTGPTDQTDCANASQLVDNTFFLNGAQQGSWLLTVRRGFDAATLAGNNIPDTANSPFVSVLPLIAQNVYGVINQKLGLNLNNPAETDLAPQSPNILAHNSVQPATNVNLYTFYGDIQVGLDVNFYVYTLPAANMLPLGDLVMLSQDDNPLASPLWGGGALCDSCGPLVNGYHSNGRYHAWALTQRYVININGLVPLLSAPDAASALQEALNSPAQHLNVSQPSAQSPGSGLPVVDATGLAGSATTDMPYEILLTLMHGDGLI
jgi:pimeloyl-ACP methyl ester carboxylesterase